MRRLLHHTHRDLKAEAVHLLQQDHARCHGWGADLPARGVCTCATQSPHQLLAALTAGVQDGMNFATVLDNLMVGSCLQTAADVDRQAPCLLYQSTSSRTERRTVCRLADEEGVGAVLCLQEDSDMAWFDLDVAPIQARCQERSDIQHIRCVCGSVCQG